MSSNTKRRLKLVLRLGLSLGLLALVYSRVDRHSLIEQLQKISLGNGLAVILLYTIGQLLSARKWKVFLDAAGLVRPWIDVVRAYFFGMFVNAFALGTFGGDLARALAVRPEAGKRAASVATTVADRVQGLAVLLTIGSVGVLFEQPPVLGTYAFAVGLFSVFALSAGWIFGPRVLTLMFKEGHRFGAAAQNIARAFPREARPFWLAAAISASFHLLQILMHVYIANFLGLGLSTAYLFAVVPLVNIAASLPISINGLGVREAMYLKLLTPAGVSEDAAVSIGAVWIIAVTLNSILGGLFLPKAERENIQHEAEKE